MRLVALLRAVNVGGTGLLPMAALRAAANEAGLRAARTVGASGNLVFDTDGSETDAHLHLTRALGGSIDVVIRPVDALLALLAANPFPDADPSKVVIVFTTSPLPPEVVASDGPAGERLVPVEGTLFVHYPDGIGRSRFLLPAAARAGTARNLRTVAQLVA